MAVGLAENGNDGEVALSVGVKGGKDVVLLLNVRLGVGNRDDELV